jgi:hypothetical protein
MRKRLIEQQSAHMVNVFEEHFHMGPTGPSKMFQLHAEGELVGFIVGGYVGRKSQHNTALHICVMNLCEYFVYGLTNYSEQIFSSRDCVFSIDVYCAGRDVHVRQLLGN